MKSLIEQSQAYWDLGMNTEAWTLAKEALALEREASGGDTTGPAAEWCVILAYRTGDFASAAERGLREPRFPVSSSAIYGIATSLHYLGRHSEAVEVLVPRVCNLSSPNDQYQLACFLSQAGRADEAVEQLFRCLPRYRNERDETWIDGDLKRLWPILAEGRFSLATAHRLVEREFDILREWQPGRKEARMLDTTHFRDLPAELRPLFDPVSRWGEYYLLPAAALAAPALAERFEQWACDEIAASQAAFDAGRRIALRRVLDAQPHYAQAAWERGDLCALRYHVQWAVQNDPARTRFAPATVESWPVQEFTYLSPRRVGTSTTEERLPKVEAYWKTATPETNDGEGAESFGEFIARVQTALEKLRHRPEQSILIVCHEMVINAARWLETRKPDFSAIHAPQQFREFFLASPIPNLGTWDYPALTWSHRGKQWTDCP